jgi:hypothetical protein
MSKCEIFGRMSGGTRPFVFANAYAPTPVGGELEAEEVHDAIQKKYLPERT